MIRLILIPIVMWSLCFSPVLVAQEPERAPAAENAAASKGPEDALNRGTPRGSVVGFLLASSKFNFEEAAEYLDLRNLPREVSEFGGPELARQLNHVLSRSVWLDDYSINDSPEGAKGDGLPDYRDELVRINTSEGEVTLFMQHVPRGDGEMIWKVSNRSVALVPGLYDEFSYPAVVEYIRTRFPEDWSFLGLETFKWFIVLCVAALSWPFYYLIGRLLTALVSSPGKEIYPFVRKALTGPFVALAILVTLGFVTERLGVSAYAQKLMNAKTLTTLVTVWALWALINLFKNHKQYKLTASGRPGAAKLVRPVAAFAKLLVLTFGMLFWLNNLGINITTLLAGLGVGGLAIALALQKPLEDMMGALTIFSQQPMRVGDFCRYGNTLGLVEEIGLRTTRMRTLTNTVVSVPNARIAYEEIENFTYRTKIRYWPTLRLRYDTTPDELQEVLDGIREMLEQHDRVHDEPLRVRFTDFDEDAILIKIHSFLDTTDFAEALEIGEGLNFRIMQIVRSAGASFAIPGRAIYMEGDVPAKS